MKKALFLIIFPILIFSCGKRPNFSVSGLIEGGAGKKIYFHKLLLNSEELLDSAYLNKEGKFTFEGSASSPSFYLLKFSKDNFITLLIDSAENCTIKGPYKEFSTKYKVDGSLGSESMRNLSLRFVSAKKQRDSLFSIFTAIKNDPLQSFRMKEVEKQYSRVTSDHSDYLVSFVKSNPFSLACIYALYQKWDDQNFVIQDLQVMKIAASALFSIYPRNEQVTALYQNTLEIVRNEATKKMNQAMKENAVNSPNIILPDADGQQRDLWALHGKYVLLHFWSAKDPSSRIINPVLAEIHQKYKQRGFEIFMVSVDTDREAWMDAIQEFNLNCINVGDMKGCFQAVTNFNIRSVPFNYLLDPEGAIIATNLKGPAINNTLSQIFK